MNINEAKIKVAALKSKIDQWAKEYYIHDMPSVDDTEYDLAMKQLKDLEQQFPKLVTSDSPTQKVGGTVSDKFEKYVHKKPMLSLADIFSWEEFEKFNKQVAKETGTVDNEYYAELKIDGLSVSLNYEKGILQNAVTRGDGKVGENVTTNVKTIKSIPLSITDKSTIEIRGEIFLSKKEFTKLNDERILKGEQLFANPRNAAAGTLRQLDSSIVAKRNLDAFLYYYLNDKDSQTNTQAKALAKIDSLGVKTNKEGRLCKTLEEVKAYIEEYTLKRSQLDYEIDGIVFKINNFNLHEQIGYTAKTPKWAVAYKFPAEVKETKLLDIFPTVGRTGKITYNAKLEPVQIAGTTVSAATLNNAEQIKTKALKVGAIVKIKKAGDIIPEVLSVVKNREYEILKQWVPAKICPACENLLEKSLGEVDQFCVNFSCPAQIVRSLEHYASRPAADIVGLGGRTIEKLYEEKIITNIADIYKIADHEEKIVSFEKFGQKSYQNLIESIIQSKTNSLDKTLFGLGIRHVGSKTAKILSERFMTIDNLAAAKYEDLNAIESIGEVLAQSIVDWFKIEANQSIIMKLKEVGVNLIYNGPQVNFNSPIVKKTFVITGTLSEPREYFKELVEQNGGKVVGSVSKKTDYLLAGVDAGSKLSKAQELNVMVINEEMLHNLLKGEKNG
ncbi:NAD-dependent DNA ligase LigA [Mesoplasma syrphidae]|uniref:DNA ligase n=1 Tax=Mesoplasma syrphidae TaxID=225999 RepID=A0A2K9C691_9MOLU|nr:NAD-dependent DNA ligase LigA [Mesoplasma syrphidae]AUF83807.1 NAD-dependent DNA ligase LigA [Mesoplasma syrphidae]